MAQEEDLRIKDLPNTKYKGFMMLDDGDGSGKMDVDTIFNKFAHNFDSAKSDGYAFSECFIYNARLYFTIDDFTGDFDSTKAMLVDTTALEFLLSHIDYFNKNALGKNGKLLTRASLVCTCYLVPIKAGSTVKITNSYTTTAGDYATFVRYNSDKTVKSYEQGASISYTTTEDEYLSFAFQPQNVFNVFVVPSAPHQDVFSSLDTIESSAVREYMLDSTKCVKEGFTVADGNIEFYSSDIGYVCQYKIKIPAGASITISKNGVLVDPYYDFVRYDSNGDVVEYVRDDYYNHTFDTDGFLSFCYMPNGSITFKANKFFETYCALNIGKPKKQFATLSIIGDSYSTYDGFIPSGNASYYGPYSQVGQVALADGVYGTWWHKVCTALGIALFLNDSWSGSRLTTSDGGIGTPMLTRIENTYGAGHVGTVKPEILVFYGVTNDSWQNVDVGEPKYSGWTADDKKQIAPALCYCYDLLHTYAPGVKILCIENYSLTATVKAAMEEICGHYGVPLVKIPSSLAKSNSHPTQRGMGQIAELVKWAVNNME